MVILVSHIHPMFQFQQSQSELVCYFAIAPGLALSPSRLTVGDSEGGLKLMVFRQCAWPRPQQPLGDSEGGFTVA